MRGATDWNSIIAISQRSKFRFPQVKLLSLRSGKRVVISGSGLSTGDEFEPVRYLVSTVF